MTNPIICTEFYDFKYWFLFIVFFFFFLLKLDVQKVSSGLQDSFKYSTWFLTVLIIIIIIIIII